MYCTRRATTAVAPVTCLVAVNGLFALDMFSRVPLFRRGGFGHDLTTRGEYTPKFRERGWGQNIMPVCSSLTHGDTIQILRTRSAPHSGAAETRARRGVTARFRRQFNAAARSGGAGPASNGPTGHWTTGPLPFRP